MESKLTRSPLSLFSRHFRRSCCHRLSGSPLVHGGASRTQDVAGGAEEGEGGEEEVDGGIWDLREDGRFGSRRGGDGSAAGAHEFMHPPIILVFGTGTR